MVTDMEISEIEDDNNRVNSATNTFKFRKKINMHFAEDEYQTDNTQQNMDNPVFAQTFDKGI